MIGISIGTYSSIYIASAFSLFLGLTREHMIEPVVEKEGEGLQFDALKNVDLTCVYKTTALKSRGFFTLKFKTPMFSNFDIQFKHRLNFYVDTVQKSI